MIFFLLYYYMHLMYKTIQKFGDSKYIKTLIQKELIKLIKSDKTNVF